MALVVVMVMVEKQTALMVLQVGDFILLEKMDL